MNKFLSVHKQKILIGLVLCVMATILVLNHENKEAHNSTTASKDNTVVLTITGEVNAPGSYTIKYGSSIMENLNLFGGFTLNANIDKVDINAPLTKDTSISVKSRSTSDSRNYDSLYELPD